MIRGALSTFSLSTFRYLWPLGRNWTRPITCLFVCLFVSASDEEQLANVTNRREALDWLLPDRSGQQEAGRVAELDGELQCSNAPLLHCTNAEWRDALTSGASVSVACRTKHWQTPQEQPAPALAYGGSNCTSQLSKHVAAAQRSALTTIVNGSSSFCVLPIGSRKSICLPVCPSVCLVASN